MASASPAAEGAQNRAGRTKANSSSTSSSCGDRGGGAMPSRRAVRLAWATITSSPVNSPSAAPRPILRAPPPSATAPAPGGTARAGGKASQGSAPVRPAEAVRESRDTPDR